MKILLLTVSYPLVNYPPYTNLGKSSKVAIDRARMKTQRVESLISQKISRFSAIQMTVYPQRKSAGLAGVLNYLLWGIGYYYLGIKNIFGIPVFALFLFEVVFTAISLFTVTVYEYFDFYTFTVRTATYYSPVTWLLIIVSFLISVALGIDAYRKCQAINMGAFPVGYQVPPAVPTGYPPPTYPPPQYMPQAPVPPRPATTQPPSAYCGQCGAPMRPDVLYCTNCGAKRI